MDLGTAITFDVDPSGAAAEPQSRVAAAADMVPQLPHEPGVEGGPAPKANTEEKIEVLVGSGPKSGKLTRRPRKDMSSPSASPVTASAVSGNTVQVLAKPPVRKLARDLGVDLATVSGSGPGGTVTRADVEAAGDAAPTPTPAAPTIRPA